MISVLSSKKIYYSLNSIDTYYWWTMLVRLPYFSAIESSSLDFILLFKDRGKFLFERNTIISLAYNTSDWINRRQFHNVEFINTLRISSRVFGASSSHRRRKMGNTHIFVTATVILIHWKLKITDQIIKTRFFVPANRVKGLGPRLCY